MTSEVLASTTQATSSRVISFDSANVVGGFINDTYFLTVIGEAPCLNMDVNLVPLIYIDCPEFWGIEVVGTLPGGFCVTAMKPFAVTIPLDGVTGTLGIEVIGHNRREKFEVAGGCREPK